MQMQQLCNLHGLTYRINMTTISPYNVIFSLFDADNVWQGSPTRKILFNGEVIDIDAWASANGITLPDGGG